MCVYFHKKNFNIQSRVYSPICFMCLHFIYVLIELIQYTLKMFQYIIRWKLEKYIVFTSLVVRRVNVDHFIKFILTEDAWYSIHVSKLVNRNYDYQLFYINFYVSLLCRCNVYRLTEIKHEITSYSHMSSCLFVSTLQWYPLFSTHLILFPHNLQ